jgi:hypothetical protein
MLGLMRLPLIPLTLWWEPAADDPSARDLVGFRFAFRRRWFFLRIPEHVEGVMWRGLVGNDNGRPW